MVLYFLFCGKFDIFGAVKVKGDHGTLSDIDKTSQRSVLRVVNHDDVQVQIEEDINKRDNHNSAGERERKENFGGLPAFSGSAIGAIGQGLGNDNDALTAISSKLRNLNHFNI